MAVEIEVMGAEELQRALAALPSKLRGRVLRGALRAAGKIIQQDAKQRAPVLQVPVPHRVRGLVKRSIALRTSKLARRRKEVGVYVTVPKVKRMKLEQRASKAMQKRGVVTERDLRDPFYFKFLETGTKHMAPRSFLGPALAAKANQAISAFMTAAIPKINELNTKR